MHVKNDAAATYKLLAAEFEKRGYTVTTRRDEESGRLVVRYVSPGGATWETSASRIGYPFTSLEGKELSVHKNEALRYAKKHGISVPETYFIDQNQPIDDETVARLLEKHPRLIVKPEDSSLSRGLSLNLTTVESVHAAVERARQVKPAVIVQEQVIGEEVRFITLKKKVVAALLRRTPRVVGDGQSTVQELIEAENAQRARLVFPYISYPRLTREMIDSRFFTDTQVLADGEILELSHATMIKDGASVYDILSHMDQTYVATVEHLMQDTGSDFMACDMFIQDFTKPQTNNNYFFIEFNTSPVLKLCYGCRDGNMFDIVPRLADVIDEALNRGR